MIDQQGRLLTVFERIAVAMEALARDEYKRVRGQVDEHTGKLLRHDAGFDAIDRRMQRVEGETEHTGSIYVADLKEKLRKHEASEAHWVRYVIAAAVALLFIFVSAGLGYALKK